MNLYDQDNLAGEYAKQNSPKGNNEAMKLTGY